MLRSRFVKAKIKPRTPLEEELYIGEWCVPKGHITEVFGGIGCGKSRVVLSSVREYIKKTNQTCLYIDLDRSHRNEDGIIFVSPSTITEVSNYITGRKFDVVVIDPLSSIVYGTNDSLGDAATQISSFMSFIQKNLLMRHDYQTRCILVNQTRRSLWGVNSESSTIGGSALSFAASLRLRVEDGERITCVKNKFQKLEK